MAEKESISSQKFEEKITEESYFLYQKSTWDIFAYTITYWILVYYQLKFFLMYIKRFFATGFLIIIAPLITVTYAIDKAGDNKAQAFDAWIKEFMVNVFIQPIHAIMYIVFVFTAGKIATEAPLLACLFLMALTRAEKIIKNVFDMRGRASIHSVSESLPLFKKA